MAEHDRNVEGQPTGRRRIRLTKPRISCGRLGPAVTNSMVRCPPTAACVEPGLGALAPDTCMRWLGRWFRGHRGCATNLTVEDPRAPVVPNRWRPASAAARGGSRMDAADVSPTVRPRWLDGRPLQVSHLYARQRASGELSSPDAERTGDDETEARHPERSVPSADDRRPMGQYSRQMEQSDNGEQSSGDNQVGSHRCSPELQPAPSA